jgi:hypothetical protein
VFSRNKETALGRLCWLLVISARSIRPLRALSMSLAACRFPKGRVQSKRFHLLIFNSGKHLLILHEKQHHRVLNAYVLYFNRARPHQGIRQQIPEPISGPVLPDHAGGKVLSFQVLGGLHHDYRGSA